MGSLGEPNCANPVGCPVYGSHLWEREKAGRNHDARAGRGIRLRICPPTSPAGLPDSFQEAISVWIDEQGLVYARTEATPDKPNMPWMQLRSDKRKFLFESSHDQFINGQLRELEEKGKTPEEAAAIVLDAQRLILEACNKLLDEEHGEPAE